MATLEMHYETAPTLLLRKILDPANCAHKRIIDEFGGGWVDGILVGGCSPSELLVGVNDYMLVGGRGRTGYKLVTGAASI